DGELAETLAASPGAARQRAAQVLARGATSGLGIAAREVSRLAAGGPPADAGPDRGAEPMPRRRILIARRPADLPVVQRRLTEFLNGAQNLRPERLGTLATAIGRCALLVGDQFPAADPTATALRGELHEHAR